MNILDPIQGIKTIAGLGASPKKSKGISTLEEAAVGKGAPVTPPEGGTAGGLTRTSILDSVIHTLFGGPESEKSPEESKKDAGKRGEAGALAQGAANNPGAAFMGIPSGGSSEFGGGIQKILQTVIGGLIGGGK